MSDNRDSTKPSKVALKEKAALEDAAQAVMNATRSLEQATLSLNLVFPDLSNVEPIITKISEPLHSAFKSAEDASTFLLQAILIWKKQFCQSPLEFSAERKQKKKETSDKNTNSSCDKTNTSSPSVNHSNNSSNQNERNESFETVTVFKEEFDPDDIAANIKEEQMEDFEQVFVGDASDIKSEPNDMDINADPDDPASAPDTKKTPLEKLKSRSFYAKSWESFLDFYCDRKEEFESRAPSEEEVIDYFTHLRIDLKRASSSLWTVYSMLNAFFKGKYEKPLQQYANLTVLMKSYDTDVKQTATLFSLDQIEQFLTKEGLNSPYWMMRKAVVLLAYFGGLKVIELADLKIENITSDSVNGILVKFKRSNEKSSKRETLFRIPRITENGFNYAQYVDSYLYAIKTQISKVSGRVFWRGSNDVFVNQPVGRNMLSGIPHQMAEILCLDSPKSYTFRSYKQTKPTKAADGNVMLEYY